MCPCDGFRCTARADEQPLRFALALRISNWGIVARPIQKGGLFVAAFRFSVSSLAHACRRSFEAGAMEDTGVSLGIEVGFGAVQQASIVPHQ